MLKHFLLVAFKCLWKNLNCNLFYYKKQPDSHHLFPQCFSLTFNILSLMNAAVENGPDIQRVQTSHIMLTGNYSGQSICTTIFVLLNWIVVLLLLTFNLTVYLVKFCVCLSSGCIAVHYFLLQYFLFILNNNILMKQWVLVWKHWASFFFFKYANQQLTVEITFIFKNEILVFKISHWHMLMISQKQLTNLVLL